MPNRTTTRFRTTLCALALLAAPAPALAAPPGACPPDPGDGSFYLCDPLDGASSAADDVVGGTFLADGGWRVDADNQHLSYDFGVQLGSGTLSYWIQGLDLATSLTHNDHWMFFMNNGLAWPDPNAEWLDIKMWGALDSGEGTVFTYGNMTCGGEPINHFNDWDGDVWYHVEVEWRPGHAEMRLDGAVWAHVETDPATCHVALRNLVVPEATTMPGVFPPFGAVYADLSAIGTAEPSCSDPCDDGNPCTGPDGCSSSVCTGLAVADGTSCDDGDPGTTDTSCRAGMCVEACSLPDPAGIVAVEDHTVDATRPDVHYADTSQIEIEGDASGNPVLASYLKFDVTVPAGRRVTAARVHLYCMDPTLPAAADGGGGEIRFVPDNGWRDATITWNTRPVASGPVLDSVESVVHGNWYDYDVSTAIADSGTYSFVLESANHNGGHFLSREGGAAGCVQPHLTLETEPVAADADADADVGDAGSDDAGRTDAEVTGDGDGGRPDGGTPDTSAGGCGCATTGRFSPGMLPFLALVVPALAPFRRRRAPFAR